MCTLFVCRYSIKLPDSFENLVLQVYRLVTLFYLSLFNTHRDSTKMSLESEEEQALRLTKFTHSNADTSQMLQVKFQQNL
jgi:hypothetical protein